MNKFFVFFCIFAVNFAAVSKPKKIAPIVKPPEVKVTVLITDKMYSKKNAYEITLSQNLNVSESIVFIATRCIRNQEKQEFVFVKMMRDGNEFFKKWIPVNESASSPIVDKRYDIAVSSCNFYENVGQNQLAKA